jgi:hypothetical protein
LREFLRRFLQKATGALGAAPQVALRRGRNPQYAVFLVLFLRLLAQKKNGENYFNVKNELL